MLMHSHQPNQACTRIIKSLAAAPKLRAERTLDALASCIVSLLDRVRHRAQRHRLRRYPYVHPSVAVGPNVCFIGPPSSFTISELTYINDAILTAGDSGRIQIGRRCSIGYRVSIKAVTHDPMEPCRDSHGVIKAIERNIIIGDACWIGDNVFIREGVTLGNNVIVGSNSVVTKSFPDDVVIAGVPAAVLRHR